MKALVSAASQAAMKACLPDLLRFTFKGMIPYEVDVHYASKIINTVVERLGWSSDYAARHVQTKLVVGSASPNGPVTVLQVDYRAARLYPFFPQSIWRHLTEGEFKVYLQGSVEEYYERFLDEMESAPHGLVTHVNRPSLKGNKGKGMNRRLKLGSTKSDYSADLYVRPNEKPGLGAHVRGGAMDKAREEAALIVGYAGNLDSAQVAQLYVDRAALKAWNYLFTKLDKAEFVLSDWVNYLFTYEEGATDKDGKCLPIEPIRLPWKVGEQDMFSLDDSGPAPAPGEDYYEYRAAQDSAEADDQAEPDLGYELTDEGGEGFDLKPTSEGRKRRK